MFIACRKLTVTLFFSGQTLISLSAAAPSAWLFRDDSSINIPRWREAELS